MELEHKVLRDHQSDGICEYKNNGKAIHGEEINKIYLASL